MKSYYILETNELCHRFDDGRVVLSEINLKVPEGAIYGFLGANGAGKTTTLRLILGLLQKQQGDIFVMGKPFADHRLEILQKTGAMIESPSLYGHLTAAENLLILQNVYRCSRARINSVLELTGLAGTGSKKVSRFSLGMKQRLSIAMALLHEPKLLILDEPTNGLDPNGMIEIRELLLTLNKQYGTTIIISSHLLGEIEKMVSHVGIIHRGSLIFQGTLPDLQKECSSDSVLFISTNDNEQAVLILRKMGVESSLTENRLSLPLPDTKVVAVLVKELVGRGIDIFEVSHSQKDLEDIFMEMITN